MRTLPDDKKALTERLKELNCLYEISRLFSQRSLSLEGLLKEIVEIIPSAFQFPERTCVRIAHAGREYRSERYLPGGLCLRERLELKKQQYGFLEVVCCADSSVSTTEFLEDEKKLVKAITELLGSIIDKKEAEMSLKRTTSDLRKKTVELEDKNIALREIVSQIELEKKAIQDQIRLNLELTVLPLLNRLRSSGASSKASDKYLKAVQQNLLDITSSFTRKVIEDRVRLSPRELEICNLIKNGLANKEIAALLQISLLTVERHRHNIRKKLKIDNKQINLATFLRDL